MSNDSRDTLRVLFVCMGNICRSPMAEGVFRRRIKERAGHLRIKVDSAGTHGYHVGSPPDKRAQAAAARRGVNIDSLASRRVHVDDFDRFDYILAMDSDNLEYLLDLAAPEQHDKIELFLNYSATSTGADVPDPYYGGPTGFERVLDLIEEASERLLADVAAAADRRR